MGRSWRVSAKARVYARCSQVANVDALKAVARAMFRWSHSPVASKFTLAYLPVSRAVPKGPSLSPR